MTKRTQRTVFGEVADTYDEVRPTYPERMIDQIIGIVDLGTRADVLDIGCGTGLLSGCFLDRGHRFLQTSALLVQICPAGGHPGDDLANHPDFKLLAELDVPWSQTYDAPSYERLMSTQSNHRLLEPESRSRLMTAIVGWFRRRRVVCGGVTSPSGGVDWPVVGVVDEGPNERFRGYAFHDAGPSTHAVLVTTGEGDHPVRIGAPLHRPRPMLTATRQAPTLGASHLVTTCCEGHPVATGT